MSRQKKLNVRRVKDFIFVSILIVALCFSNWLIICGLFWFICACFGLHFTWSAAARIWIVLCCLMGLFNTKSK